MQQIDRFLEAANTFITKIEPLIKVQIKSYNPIPGNNFHQRYKELEPGCGIYLFVAPESGRVLYVGQSTNIYGRFLQHIGRGYRFGENNECFPNFGLTVIYHWAQPETKQILRSGNFHVHVFEVEPPNMRWLLESFLIAYGRSNYENTPELNVEG